LLGLRKQARRRFDYHQGILLARSPDPRKSRAIKPSTTHSKKPHQSKDFTLGFLLEWGDLIDSSESFVTHWEVPTLVLTAGCDCIVKPTQISLWFEKVSASDKQLHIYQDTHHLLWHDWDKEAVLSDIHAWLTEHI